MSDEQAPKKEGDAGAPAWVMTFADLMSLLMCFFVLLLSFSEMDVQKYKQISGSMKAAFGVQREVVANEIPKGNSIIAKNFSPGKPEPTIAAKVQQETSNTDLDKLKKSKSKSDKVKSEVAARKLASALKKEITEGKLEIEAIDKKIIIRIQSKNSFNSGSSDVSTDFKPVLEKLHNEISKVDGMIEVAGHTDDNPISTNLFRSNWDLSTARAVSVAHELMKDGKIQENRFKIVGYGDTQPRVPNTSDENRSKNRRVDITIDQGDVPKSLINPVKNQETETEESLEP